MRLSFVVRDKALTKLEVIYLNFTSTTRTTHILLQFLSRKNRFPHSWAVVGPRWIDYEPRRMLISKCLAARMQEILPDASKSRSKAKNKPLRPPRLSSRNAPKHLTTL